LRPGLAKPYPLDILKRGTAVAAVVKLCRARRGMIGHVARAFEQAAIFEIGGDARAPERMIADGGAGIVFGILIKGEISALGSGASRNCWSRPGASKGGRDCACAP